MRAGAMAKNGSTIPSLAREPPSPSDRTQEVAGSSPASSILKNPVLTGLTCFRRRQLTGGAKPHGNWGVRA